MEDDDNYLNCNFCSEKFDTDERTPRMLPQCGHSICEICLLEYLDIKIAIRCYVDDVIIKTEAKTLADFPINNSLLKIVSNHQKEDSSNEGSLIEISYQDDNDQPDSEENLKFKDEYSKYNQKENFHDHDKKRGERDFAEDKDNNQQEIYKISDNEEVEEESDDAEDYQVDINEEVSESQFSESEREILQSKADMGKSFLNEEESRFINESEIDESFNQFDAKVSENKHFYQQTHNKEEMSEIDNSILSDKIDNINNSQNTLLETKFSTWDKSDKKEKDVNKKLQKSKFEKKKNFQNEVDSKISYSEVDDDEVFCRSHKMDLDIICINCTTRICYHCGLFGDHKNHTVKTEEEFFKEVSKYQTEITKSLKKIGNEENFLKNKFIEKCYDLQSNQKLNDINMKIIDGFDKVISKLQKQKEELLESANKIFKDTGKLLREEIQAELEMIDEKMGLNIKRELMSLLKKISKGEEDETFLYRIMNEKDNLKIIIKSESILEEIKSKSKHFQKKVHDFIDHTDVNINKNFDYILGQMKNQQFNNTDILDCSFNSELSGENLLGDSALLNSSPVFENFISNSSFQNGGDKTPLMCERNTNNMSNRFSINMNNKSMNSFNNRKTIGEFNNVNTLNRDHYNLQGINKASDDYTYCKTPQNNNRFMQGNNSFSYQNNLNRLQKINSFTGLQSNVQNNFSTQNKNMNSMTQFEFESKSNSFNLKTENNKQEKLNTRLTPPNDTIIKSPGDLSFIKKINKKSLEDTIIKKKKNQKAKKSGKKENDFEFLRKQKNIKFLDLSDIKITDKYMNNLFLLLNDSPNLNLLILKNIKISDDGVRTLCNHLLDRKIENLDLSCNNLNKISVTYLKQLADTNKHLKIINFKDNLITSANIQKKIVEEFAEIGVTFHIK